MLIPHRAGADVPDEHGCPSFGVSDLRARLMDPTDLDVRDRQRLMSLANRLARVQALGGEYARVEFSAHVATARDGSAAVP